MLRDPVAGETGRLRMGGEIGGAGERVRYGAAFDDGNEIEER